MNVSKLQLQFDIIWVMGTPDCGKSLLSTYLSKHLKFYIISISRVIKTASKIRGVRGQLLDKMVNEQKKIPDRIVVELIGEEMTKNFSVGYVIDGFPWTVSQAKKFMTQLRKPKLIIYLDISLDGILARMIALFGDIDLNLVRKKYIRSKKNLDRVYRAFSDLVIVLPAKYPAIDVFLDLLGELESITR